jgi:membrane protein required for beta-lactamase induction
MLIFTVLHILSMFTMVTVFLGGAFYYAYAVWRRDVRALATFHRIERQSRIGIVGIVALFAGLAFGLLAVLTGGIDVLDGWLIAAYVLVAAFVAYVGISEKTLMELGDKAVEADAGGRPVEEVVRDMADSPAIRFFTVNVVLFAAIIVDMVVKPF